MMPKLWYPPLLSLAPVLLRQSELADWGEPKLSGEVLGMQLLHVTSPYVQRITDGCKPRLITFIVFCYKSYPHFLLLCSMCQSLYIWLVGRKRRSFPFNPYYTSMLPGSGSCSALSFIFCTRKRWGSLNEFLTILKIGELQELDPLFLYFWYWILLKLATINFFILVLTFSYKGAESFGALTRK